MQPPRTKRQVQLHTAHDARSLVGVLQPGRLDSLFRFEYMVEGSPIPHHIELPRRLLNPQLAVGARTILTLVITQADMMETEVPADPEPLPGLVGFNGKKLS